MPANLEEELFGAVLALPESERDGYLNRACGEDIALRARVLALVETAVDLETAHSPLNKELAEEQVGEYRLIEEIGAGGCGIVFLAEQPAPVRRHVAIKIIKPGMDTREVIARFAAEQQALARMDHPNIAAVFDAGVTSKCRSYFVMEMVRGIRITQYCDQSRLDVPERLALFSQLCEAIHHAHTKGIIHRDIKPSNVLVTLREGTPVVKVIDFGIAKALQGSLTELTVSTLLGQFLGTPAYVSPEQTDPGAIAIDARSDIYSLGAVLYELLTGSAPIAAEELSRGSLDTVRRRIREEEPPTPSQRLARKHASASLSKQVRGDLEWIVMRCLEKDRTRRYPTVGDLLLDLQRHSRHEPVSARPPGAIYSFRKFARRHRVAVASGALILLILTLSTIVSASLAVRALNAERQARTEAASRQEVIDFLRNDLLSQASPRSTPDRDLQLRVVLDRAARRISGRFSNDPLVEASVREVLGSTYGSLGEYAAGREHLERVLAIYQRQFGEKDARTLRTTTLLVPLLRNEGRLPEAERLGSRILQQQRRALGQAHPDTLSTLIELAVVYTDQGRNEAAAALLTQAVDLYTRSVGVAHPQTLLAMHQLAIAYTKLDKLQEAEALLRQTLKTLREIVPADHPEALYVTNSLAVACSRQGRFAEAALLQSQNIDALVRVLGPEHPDTLTAMTNVAVQYEHIGKYAEAEAVLSRALDIWRKRAPEHPNALGAMNNLGNLYRLQGRLAEAHVLLVQALTGARKAWGPEHPQTLLIQRNLAMTETEQGRTREAETLLSSGLAIATRVFGAAHPQTLKYEMQLGTLLLQTGRIQQAEPLLRSAVAYPKTAPDHWRRFVAQSLLGEALLRSHRVSEAEPLIVEGLRGLRAYAQALPASFHFALQDAERRFDQLPKVVRTASENQPFAPSMPEAKGR